mmetsp:Transcript_33899/g.91768  ORF Transcript_33899/g.91768 Transcript_33899/m.91768 type:complete len:163 (-) Transcript_33899:49-537(-)
MPPSLAFQPQEVQDIIFKLQEDPFTPVHIVRVGDAESPAPFAMKLFEHEEGEPPEPLAIGKGVKRVLVICDGHRGVAGAQGYCREVRRAQRKMELVVQLVDVPKNPDRVHLLSQVLLKAGASKVSVGGVTFDEGGGERITAASPLSLTIQSQEGSVTLGTVL